MKLLYITNGINGPGGLERVLSIKASYLADHYGYEVTILSLNENHLNPFYEFSSKIQQLSIAVSGNPFQYIKAYRLGIKKIVRQVQPDVISVCDDGLKGFFVPKIISEHIPVIYERHVSKDIEMKADFSFTKKASVRLKWRLMETLAQGFSRFVVLTQGNTKEWESLDNMQVIANPLSFYPKASSTLQTKRVLAVGKHGYQKSYDRLLEAWQIVNKNFPDWNLDIYGTISPQYQLAAQAQALGIDASVNFFAPEKDIVSKYLDASIYVMSSRFEGFGMVLIEAMACGLPCVSFDCNYGPSDIIKDGVDGYLVKNGDIKTLAHKISTLITEEKLKQQMGAAAKENVKRYLPKMIVKQWDELFKSLVS